MSRIEERMMRLALRAATVQRRAVIARLIAQAAQTMPADVTMSAGDDGVVLTGRGLRARAWGRWGRPGDARLRGLGGGA
jgi:hypothetical protein